MSLASSEPKRKTKRQQQFRSSTFVAVVKKKKCHALAAKAARDKLFRALEGSARGRRAPTKNDNGKKKVEGNKKKSNEGNIMRAKRRLNERWTEIHLFWRAPSRPTRTSLAADQRNQKITSPEGWKCGKISSAAGERHGTCCHDQVSMHFSSTTREREKRRDFSLS